MASRKEEKERLRAQRLAAERAAASTGQRRLIAGYVVAALLALAVVAGLVVVLVSGNGNSARGEHLRQRSHQELWRHLPGARAGLP